MTFFMVPSPPEHRKISRRVGCCHITMSWIMVKCTPDYGYSNTDQRSHLWCGCFIFCNQAPTHQSISQPGRDRILVLFRHGIYSPHLFCAAQWLALFRVYLNIFVLSVVTSSHSIFTDFVEAGTGAGGITIPIISSSNDDACHDGLM